MPTYDYQCTQCNHGFEELQKISAPPLSTCPKCGKDSLKKIPSRGIGVHFNGSGFYATDYGNEKSGSCCPCGKNKGACER